MSVSSQEWVLTELELVIQFSGTNAAKLGANYGVTTFPPF